MIISWILFLAAAGVYVGIWAISKFSVKEQASYYYSTSPVSVSPYIEVDQTATQCDQSVVASATPFYTNGENSTAQAVALALVLSWMMWKFPLAMFQLHLIFDAPNRILKYVSWGVSLALMLAGDILLTVYLPAVYQEYMFYAFSALLAIILSVVNNRLMLLQSLLSAFLPLFFIALLYFSYSYFLPSLFAVFVKFVNGYEYLLIYGYPVLDALLYSGLLLINSRRLETAQPMLSFVQFFLVGYLAGITLLASVTEVEFYYLVAYALFRNVFTNWVMYRWEKVVNNPPCLPGWGIMYYLSYLLNFLPVIGLGRLVLSRSFLSQQFSQACLLLSYYSGNSYPYAYVTPLISEYNLSFVGYMFWPAALIIWFVTSVSQKYPTRRPTLFDFFYNLGGIYMFYLGISGGLQLLTLRQVSLFA